MVHPSCIEPVTHLLYANLVHVSVIGRTGGGWSKAAEYAVAVGEGPGRDVGPEGDGVEFVGHAGA